MLSQKSQTTVSKTEEKKVLPSERLVNLFHQARALFVYSKVGDEIDEDYWPAFATLPAGKEFGDKKYPAFRELVSEEEYVKWMTFAWYSKSINDRIINFPCLDELVDWLPEMFESCQCVKQTEYVSQWGKTLKRFRKILAYHEGGTRHKKNGAFMDLGTELSSKRRRDVLDFSQSNFLIMFIDFLPEPI